MVTPLLTSVPISGGGRASKYCVLRNPVTPLAATLNMRSSSSVEVSNGSLIGSSSAAGGLGEVSTAGT